MASIQVVSSGGLEYQLFLCHKHSWTECMVTKARFRVRPGSWTRFAAHKACWLCMLGRVRMDPRPTLVLPLDR